MNEPSDPVTDMHMHIHATYNRSSSINFKRRLTEAGEVAFNPT